MFNKLTYVIFNATVLSVATAIAVWLTINGHMRQVEGLLVVMGAILGAVLFGFRLAEGFGPTHLSIWAGPLYTIPPTAPGLGSNGDELGNAA